MSFGFLASQASAASPHASSRAGIRDTMVGHPSAIASTGGRPKPSYSDG